MREHTNRLAAAQSSQSACLAPIHNKQFTTNDKIQTKFNLSWTVSVQLRVKLCSKRLSFVRNQMLTFGKREMIRTTGPRTHFKLALTSHRQTSKFPDPYYESIPFSTKIVVDQGSNTSQYMLDVLGCIKKLGGCTEMYQRIMMYWMLIHQLVIHCPIHRMY